MNFTIDLECDKRNAGSWFMLTYYFTILLLFYFVSFIWYQEGRSFWSKTRFFI